MAPRYSSIRFVTHDWNRDGNLRWAIYCYGGLFTPTGRGEHYAAGRVREFKLNNTPPPVAGRRYRLSITAGHDWVVVRIDGEQVLKLTDYPLRHGGPGTWTHGYISAMYGGNSPDYGPVTTRSGFVDFHQLKAVKL